MTTELNPLYAKHKLAYETHKVLDNLGFDSAPEQIEISSRTKNLVREPKVYQAHISMFKLYLKLSGGNN
ncbi:MAG: hypothetical protein AABX85_02275 [Nanoarchaeota archaeon]